jgi:hypothetical protein
MLVVQDNVGITFAADENFRRDEGKAILLSIRS